MARFTDNFDRADGEIGANWIEDLGDIDIVSNVAESMTAGMFNLARYASPLDSDDQVVSAIIGGKAATNQGGVFARQAATAHTHYGAVYNSQNDAQGYRLRRYTNGTEVDLASAPSGSGAKLITLRVVGAWQYMLVDGVVVAQASDATITTGKYAGIFAWANGGGRWNDFSAEDYLPGPPGRIYRRQGFQ